MILALLGYVGTMLTAFVVLVMAWHHVLGPTQMEKVQQAPRPIGAVARDAGAAPQPGTMQLGGTLAGGAPTGGTWGPPGVNKADDRSSTDDAGTAAAKQAEAEKAKRQRQARYQKRKEQLARQQQDQQYSTVLGYDRERPQEFSSGQFSSSPGSSSPSSSSPGPSFNPFGPRRF